MLKKDFSLSFKDSDTVILCPVYAAGEKTDIKYDQVKFSNMISKNSNVQVIIIKNEINLKKYFIKNLLKDEIVICMGAGSISKWIREMKIKWDVMKGRVR